MGFAHYIIIRGVWRKLLRPEAFDRNDRGMTLKAFPVSELPAFLQDTPGARDVHGPVYGRWQKRAGIDILVAFVAVLLRHDKKQKHGLRGEFPVKIVVGDNWKAGPLRA